MNPNRRPTPQITAEQRSKVSNSVTVESRAHPRPDTKPHLLVEDVIAFGKALEDAEAPLYESVRAWDRNDVLFGLRVDWSQDLINGQPAPQAEERDQP